MTNSGTEATTMANQQGKRQGERESSTMTKSGDESSTMAKSGDGGERESSTMARAGDGGERAIVTRQYQDPFSLLDSLVERMQRDFLGTTLFNAMLPARAAEGDRDVIRVPRVQMRDTGDALELTAELPGIEADNVKVELEDDVLTISGEAESEEEREGARIERYVSFYRQIPIPDGIDADGAQASYRNGVLSIRFPKRAERSNAKQIPVTTGQSAEQGGQQATATAGKSGEQGGQQAGQQAKEKAA
jgi:HSP20 family protein